MKKYIIALSLVLSLLFVGCGEYKPTAEEKQTQQTKQALNQMNNQIGMPNIKEFYEKKMAKEIFELRDNSKLVCFAYTQAMNGKFIYLGKCFGYGLPYSVQYTNPQQILEYGQSGGGNVTIPQADPNGLYMPEGLSATWLMMINETTGEREIMYAEPNVVVKQSKLPKRLVEDWSLTKDY